MNLSTYIDEYRKLAIDAIRELEIKFNTDNLSRDSFVRHKSKIPQKGDFMLNGKPATFYFHGIGCTIVTDGKEVSFDFSPERYKIVFDFYHIHRFLKSQRIEHDEEEIKKNLQGSTKMSTNHVITGPLIAIVIGFFIILLFLGSFRNGTMNTSPPPKQLIEIKSRTEVPDFADIALSIEDYSATGQGGYSMVVKGVYKNAVVGIRISGDGKEKVIFESIGQESDAFVKALVEIYGKPVKHSAFSTSPVVFAAIALSAEHFKLFYDPEFRQELYAEWYLNIDLPKKEILLGEKDPEYRQNLLTALTK